jgi:hypothetical protein
VSLLSKSIYIKDNDTSHIKRNERFYELSEVKAVGSEDLSEVYIKLWGKNRAERIATKRGVLLTMFMNNTGRVINLNAYVRETSSITLKEFDKLTRYFKNNLIIKVPPNLDDTRTVVAGGFPIWIPRAVLKDGNYKIGSRIFTVTSMGHRISVMDNAILNYTDLNKDSRFKLDNVELANISNLAHAFKDVLGNEGMMSIRNYRHLDIVISGWIDHSGKILAHNFFLPVRLPVSIEELGKISNLIRKQVTLKISDEISEEQVGTFTYTLPIKSLE